MGSDTILFGPALFAYDPVTDFQVRMGFLLCKVFFSFLIVGGKCSSAIHI